MTQLATTKAAPLATSAVVDDDERTDLIKRTIAKDATDAELELFLYQVKRTGLDPMAKQIYFQKRFNKRAGRSEMTIITGIDGYRLIADRTGKYAGNDDPVFDDEQQPGKATVTVYKIVGGIRCPFTASARWEQYYPGDEQGFMWRKMPNLMLGKCAEALALRKAFPAELSGIYVKEEMDQAGEPETLDVAAATPPAAPPAPKAEPVVQRGRAYDPKNSADEKLLASILAKQKVPEQFWGEIDTRMDGKFMSDVPSVIAAVRSGQ